MNDFPITDGQDFLASLPLRPHTLGTRELCAKLGLTMFVGGTIPKQPEERIRQIAGYLFIQSQPLPVVLSAAKSADFYNDHLLPWMFRLTPGVITQAMDLIEANMNAIDARTVDVEPKPAIPGARQEDPPPNS